MALSNAERQRRYIARLKAQGAPQPKRDDAEKPERKRSPTEAEVIIKRLKKQLKEVRAERNHLKEKLQC